MGYLSRGRHRKSTKSRWLVLGAIASVSLIAFGYYEIFDQLDYSVASVKTYATASRVPSRVAAPAVPTSSSAPPSTTVAPTTDPPTLTKEAQRPTQRPTKPPVTKSTTPPSPSHQTEDPKPSAKPTAPLPPAPKIISSVKCSALGVQPIALRACNVIAALFPQVKTIGGRAARPSNHTSCHPLGLALDVMVGSNSLGDSVNAWARAHKAEYGIGWIGWEVPDHWDHVHLSFNPCKG